VTSIVFGHCGHLGECHVGSFLNGSFIMLLEAQVIFESFQVHWWVTSEWLPNDLFCCFKCQFCSILPIVADTLYRQWEHLKWGSFCLCKNYKIWFIYAYLLLNEEHHYVWQIFDVERWCQAMVEANNQNICMSTRWHSAKFFCNLLLQCCCWVSGWNSKVSHSYGHSHKRATFFAWLMLLLQRPFQEAPTIESSYFL